MWVLMGIASAFLQGLYDVFKKESLKDNAVIPVLLINTLLCAGFFVPGIIGSAACAISPGDRMFVPSGTLHDHLLIMLKAVIVLSSWICGYFAIKNLPLTIAGPINATRPVMTLVGAMLIFGERLNLLQWAGVTTAVISFLLLSRSGKKEGIDFKSNSSIFLLILAAILGSSSGLYDKYLMSEGTGLGMDRSFVQGWYYLYQAIMRCGIFAFLWIPDRKKSRFTWKWSIPLISITLTVSDMIYLHALSIPGAMVSILSMLRRSSVLVSFIFGALFLKEKNIKGKAIDLALVFVSLMFLIAGTL